MNNLFEFVQALIVVHDAGVERNQDRNDLSNHFKCHDYPTEKDIDMYLETRKKLRAVRLKSLDIVNGTKDLEQVSKCYKNPNFTGFKCNDCDCKEWN